MATWMLPWSYELWVPISCKEQDLLTFQIALTLKTKQHFFFFWTRCTMETTRVARISALCPAAVQGRGHPLTPQRVHHDQRRGLLQGVGHRRPAPDVQYLTYHQGTIKHKPQRVCLSASSCYQQEMSLDVWYNNPSCSVTFLQNDAIIQQLAAIFSHCFGAAPLPAVPEMKATLSAQLGRETMILMNTHSSAFRVDNYDGFTLIFLDYFHYWLICWLFSWLVDTFLVYKIPQKCEESPTYHTFLKPKVKLSNCLFQISKISLLSWKTNTGSNSSQLKSWNQGIFSIFAWKCTWIINQLSKWSTAQFIN